MQPSTTPSTTTTSGGRKRKYIGTLVPPAFPSLIVPPCSVVARQLGGHPCPPLLPPLPPCAPLAPPPSSSPPPPTRARRRRGCHDYASGCRHRSGGERSPTQQHYWRPAVGTISDWYKHASLAPNRSTTIRTCRHARASHALTLAPPPPGAPAQAHSILIRQARASLVPSIRVQTRGRGRGRGRPSTRGEMSCAGATASTRATHGYVKKPTWRSWSKQYSRSRQTPRCERV